MSDVKDAVQWIIVGLVCGLIIGGAVGMEQGEKMAPKNEYTIYRNGTLDVYEAISMSKSLPEDLTDVYKVESEVYTVFLWTQKAMFIQENENLWLKMKVLKK